MITFSDEPEVVSDFTSSVDEIQGKLVFTVPRRRTALLDAIYMGVTKMRQAKYAKKALLIISDGGDNHSRYTESEIKAQVKEADVMYMPSVFTTAISKPRKNGWARNCWDRLRNCPVGGLYGGKSERSGGCGDQDWGGTAEPVCAGYRPLNGSRDGKWRKIKVKLLPPKGLPPLKVYARTGYYAPEE